MTRPPINIVVDFDGTFNDPTDDHTTNVFRLHQGLVNDDRQVTLYIPGVGNEQDSNFLSHWAGGAFGYGADGKKEEAIEFINGHYQDGDRVFVHGFSRGAATGRDTAGDLKHVTFLGCFDTVGAFGLPIGFGQDINLFKDMHVGAHVQNALHLVSLDETRPAFVPTLMNEREGINEIWLPGVHSDVGGGEPHRGLSDVSLGIMAREAEKHGLALQDGFYEALQPDLNGIIHYNTDSKLGADPRIACIQRGDGPTKDLARVHPNVIERMKSGWWPMAWRPT